MAILASEALLREENPVTKCYPPLPVGIEPLIPTLYNYGKIRLDLGGVYCTVCDKFRDCRFKLNSATSLLYF